MHRPGTTAVLGSGGVRGRVRARRSGDHVTGPAALPRWRPRQLTGPAGSMAPVTARGCRHAAVHGRPGPVLRRVAGGRGVREGAVPGCPAQDGCLAGALERRRALGCLGRRAVPARRDRAPQAAAWASRKTDVRGLSRRSVPDGRRQRTARAVAVLRDVAHATRQLVGRCGSRSMLDRAHAAERAARRGRLRALSRASRRAAAGQRKPGPGPARGRCGCDSVSSARLSRWSTDARRGLGCSARCRDGQGRSPAASAGPRACGGRAGRLRRPGAACPAGPHAPGGLAGLGRTVSAAGSSRPGGSASE